MLDGPDGAGKSTQVQLLTEQLAKRGIHSISLREPGGTTAGEVIRSLLLERRQDKLTPVAETFLFEAARAQLVEEIVRPALQSGTWVICDRFTLSTLVYQGYAGGVDPKAIELMSKVATGGLQPDLYLVLWVDAAVGIARREARQADRMEAKGRRFIEAVSAAYKKLARGKHGKYAFIEAGGLVEGVRTQVWKQVEQLL
ncbi:MAG: dTMP kinase [Planctomycetes bacterium]|nr:dTMP kinase [Planctomycetota bacterium]